MKVQTRQKNVVENVHCVDKCGGVRVRKGSTKNCLLFGMFIVPSENYPPIHSSRLTNKSAHTSFDSIDSPRKAGN
jgi:hypothetical protein